MKIEKQIGAVKGTLTFDDYVSGRIHVKIDNVCSNEIKPIGFGISPNVDTEIETRTIQEDFETTYIDKLDGNVPSYAGTDVDIGTRYFGLSNTGRTQNIGTQGFIDGNSFLIKKNDEELDTKTSSSTEFDYFIGGKWNFTCINNDYAIINDMCEGRILNNGKHYTADEINDIIEKDFLVSYYDPKMVCGYYPSGSCSLYMFKGPYAMNLPYAPNSYYHGNWNTFKVKNKTYEEGGKTKTSEDCEFDIDPESSTPLRTLSFKVWDTENPSFLTYLDAHPGEDLTFVNMSSGGGDSCESWMETNDKIMIEVNDRCYYCKLVFFNKSSVPDNPSSLGSIPRNFKTYLAGLERYVQVTYADGVIKNYTRNGVPAKLLGKIVNDDKSKYSNWTYLTLDASEHVISKSYKFWYRIHIGKVGESGYTYEYNDRNEVPDKNCYLINEVERIIGKPIPFLSNCVIRINKDKSLNSFDITEFTDDDAWFSLDGTYDKIVGVKTTTLNLASLLGKNENHYTWDEIAEYQSFNEFVEQVFKNNGLDVSCVKTNDISLYIHYPTVEYTYEEGKQLKIEEGSFLYSPSGSQEPTPYVNTREVHILLDSVDDENHDYKYGYDTSAFIKLMNERNISLPDPNDEATAFAKKYNEFYNNYIKLRSDFVRDYSVTNELTIQTGASAVKPAFLINNSFVFSFDDYFAFIPGGSNGEAFKRYFSNVWQDENYTYFDLVIENFIFGDVTLIDTNSNVIEILEHEDIWRCYSHFGVVKPDEYYTLRTSGAALNNALIHYKNCRGKIDPVLDTTFDLTEHTSLGNVYKVTDIAMGSRGVDSTTKSVEYYNNYPMSDFGWPIARIYHARIPRTGCIDELIIIASNKFYPEMISLKSALYDVSLRYRYNDNSEDRWVNENTFFYAHQYTDLTICFKDNFGTRLQNIENLNFDLIEYYTHEHTNLSAIGEFPRKICKETKGIYAENLTFNEATGENEIRLVIPNHMTFDNEPCGFHDGELVVTYNINDDFRKEWWIKFKNQDIYVETRLHPNVVHNVNPYKNVADAEDPVILNTDSRVDYGNFMGMFTGNFYYGNNFNYAQDYLFTNSTPLYDLSGVCYMPKDLAESGYVFSGFNSHMTDTATGNEGVKIAYETNDEGFKDIPVLCSAFDYNFTGEYNITKFVQKLIPYDMTEADAEAGNFGNHTDKIYKNAVKFGAVITKK